MCTTRVGFGQLCYLVVVGLAYITEHVNNNMTELCFKPIGSGQA